MCSVRGCLLYHCCCSGHSAACILLLPLHASFLCSACTIPSTSAGSRLPLEASWPILPPEHLPCLGATYLQVGGAIFLLLLVLGGRKRADATTPSYIPISPSWRTRCSIAQIGIEESVASSAIAQCLRFVQRGWFSAANLRLRCGHRGCRSRLSRVLRAFAFIGISAER